MNDNPSSAVHTETRRLAAIMFTDIVGFSRQMGATKPTCCGCWPFITRSSNKQSLPITARSSRRRRCLLGGFPFRRARGPVRPVDSSPVRTLQCRERESRPDSRPHRHSSRRHRPARWRCVRRWREYRLASPEPGRARHDLHFAEGVSRKSRRNCAWAQWCPWGNPKLKNIAQRFAVYAFSPSSPKDCARRCKCSGSSSLVGCARRTGGSGGTAARRWHHS